MFWLISYIICLCIVSLCILLIPFKILSIDYMLYSSNHGYIYFCNMKHLGVLPSGEIYIYKRFPFDNVSVGRKLLISIYPLNKKNHNTILTKIILAYSSFL